ncbi:MAG: ABC transporter substrate-binding protein [Pseudomonadota bacterium]
MIRFAIIFAALVTLLSTSLRADPVRLGWQTPWAVQGQLVMGLREGGLAAAEGLDVKYVGFAYGAPLNQAALAGSVDILLTADQPAVALLARSEDYSIVSRMMYNRVCIYVPVGSSLASVSDLNGRTIGGPIGAAAERVASSVLSDNGFSRTSVTKMKHW